jgi:exonuclease SbcC
VKILAIRGRALASLSGDFEIDFAAPPLKDLGLFTITGDTGTGKSTILDALCLALYQTAPRLLDQGRGETTVKDRDGEKTDPVLSRGDPRTLITRGTGGGFAEVDFVGRDGERYRARWEAWRAGNKPTGKFQEARTRIVELATGVVLAEKKKDVSELVARLVGLKLEQFTRSALLAQGRFAAFLGAKAGERAELLEQMTGAEIYSRISMQAHQRAVQVKAELSELESAWAATAVLDEALRADLEQRISMLESEGAQREAELRELEQAVQWHAELSALREKEAQAAASRQQAEEELGRLEPLRAELAEVERAEPFRALIVARDATRTAEHQAVEVRTAATRVRDELASESERAATQIGILEASTGAAEAALKRAQPELELASKSDERIEQRDQESARTKAQVEEARTRRDQARRAADALEVRVERARVALSEAESVLDSEPVALRLVDRWDSVAQEIRRFAEQRVEVERAEREVVRCGGLLADLELELARQRRELGAKSARLKDLRAEHERRSEEATTAALSDDDREARSRAQSERDCLQGAVLPLLRELEEHAREEAEQRLAAAKAQSKASLAAEEHCREVRALEEARHALEQTRATLGLTDHRAALVPGEPCPLCGATEHPYAAETPAVAELVAAQQARVRELDELVARLLSAHASESAREQQASLRAAEASAALAQGRERLHGIAHDSGIGLELLGREWADQRLSALRVALESFERRDRTYAERRALADEASRALLETQASFDTLEQCVKELTTEQAELGKREALAISARERAAAACADHETALRPSLEGRLGWGEQLATDPLGLLADCERDAVRLRGVLTSRDQAKKSIGEIEGELGAARARLDELSRQVAEAETAALESARALQDERTARSGLLGGRPTETVRNELEQALNTARQAEREARQAAAALGDRLKQAELELAGASKALELAGAAARTATAMLDNALLAAGTTETALEPVLARDAQWVASMRASLEQAAKQVERARALYEERERDRAAHELNGAPRLDAEAARGARDAALAAQKQRLEALAEARSTRKLDDEARAQRGEKDRALAALREKARRWQALDQLIGAADGKKFRMFAQSLTLDALLAYANAHLRDLVPRYRIRRVSGQDMELEIVDGQMGDEARGTNTLSGGETFLVSLALALALSSLAARDVRIDTVFIDEGFGSLDGRTLGVAVAALEALHASGRQVGIISHVEALSDRIGAQVRVERCGSGRSQIRVGGRLARPASEEAPKRAGRKRKVEAVG